MHSKPLNDRALPRNGRACHLLRKYRRARYLASGRQLLAVPIQGPYHPCEGRIAQLRPRLAPQCQRALATPSQMHAPKLRPRRSPNRHRRRTGRSRIQQPKAHPTHDLPRRRHRPHQPTVPQDPAKPPQVTRPPPRRARYLLPSSSFSNIAILPLRKTCPKWSNWNRPYWK